MKVKCIKSCFPFEEKNKIYEVTGQYIGNAGDKKGVAYTEIKIQNYPSMVQQIKTEDLKNGNSNFAIIN